MLPFIVIIGIALADQLVKYWAFTALRPIGTISLIPHVFQLTYVENRGAAFSILQNQVWLFAVLTFAVLAAIVIALWKKAIHTPMGKWSLYLVAGGAVGNLLDRILRGFVVDLFDFRLIHFPVFNVADVFVCVGGVLFFIYLMTQPER